MILMKKMDLLNKIFKNHFKFFLVCLAMFSVFYTFLYGIWQIPFADIGFNRAEGAIVFDYVYIVSITFLSSVLMTLIKYERSENLVVEKRFFAIGGILAAFVSAVCPICQGIAIFAFSGTFVAALPLAFLIPYLFLIQIASLAILLIALYLKINSIYTLRCNCK